MFLELQNESHIFVANLQREEFALEPEGVVSSMLELPRVRTQGCLFAPAETTKPGWLPSSGVATGGANCGSGEVASPAVAAAGGLTTCTRMKPPQDLIKLEDRLRFLLQPPLESLLAAYALRFPHAPFPFQLDGMAFLYARNRAVLADEMGLGKTMQTVSSIRLLVHHGQLRRVLLVCPKPLVTNWQREFALWAPEVPVGVIEGGPARRQWLWRSTTDVVTIANYETVVRDREDVCQRESHFDLVVLDESQRIKNISSATNEVTRSIPRSRSWALTGTPIENSTEDLRGIFEFVAPGQLVPKMKPRAVGKAVGDFVLRRTKDQVLTDLPPKMFRDANIALTPEQAESYRLAEDEGVVHLREIKQQLTIQHVFELVLRLKQICNFDPASGSSSKFDRLEADLEECAASGRKAIVFSQWVETLTELRRRLGRFNPVEYHGQIANRRRDEVIERFRSDCDCHVILMSYGAGSVGLNLQFASYVFLFDRWWNPAVEDQAINRAHRIGAKRSVTITRFLTVDTIEQRIHDILERKRALFDTVFSDAVAAPSAGLTREEIFSLFKLDAAGHDHTAAA
ncbi:MAG: DEAD/DEAH box helicase [Pirellulales bacterium]|nr:DEAD/DEAH box helicase [Pirellulales bacterium]